MSRVENEPLVLEMRDVAYAYPGQAGWAINNVNLKFGSGQKVAVLGRNGSGKSTLLMVAAGLLRPTRGQLIVNGQPVVLDLQGALGLRRLVAAVFMNCDDQIMDAHFGGRNPAQISTYETDHSLAEWTQDQAYLQRIERVNELRRVVNAMLRPRHALSLGEQAIAAIENAMQLRARILILDHALDCLDPFACSKLLNMLDAFVDRGGLVMLTSHDAETMRDWADLFVVMAGHEVLMAASPACIFGDPFLRRIVLGDFSHA